jgi:glycerophosphodiester phosphodiesterase
VLDAPELAANKAEIKAALSAPVQLRQFGQLLDVSADLIALGGHRGMGMNMPAAVDPRPNQYRENTLLSFKRAAANGASFVEFDVQVTRDGVPVIFHDDDVITGSCADPQQQTSRHVADMTLAEFKALTSPSGLCAQQPLLRWSRALPEKAMLPSLHVWRVAADEQMPTLAELFEQLPKSVGFDIEVKMTTPDHVAATPQAEIKRMADAITAVVEAASRNSNRRVIFSSFDPDMCTALAQQQRQSAQNTGAMDSNRAATAQYSQSQAALLPVAAAAEELITPHTIASIPVFLLSDVGDTAHADIRRNTISAAVDFAMQHDLRGIILDTAKLQQEPHMVAAARNNGLMVMTYGVENNQPEWVRKQAFLGVQGAIVDDVAGVAQALSRPALVM